ncbi:PilZ domain-containing protein [Sphingomonas sp. CJ20]
MSERTRTRHEPEVAAAQAAAAPDIGWLRDCLVAAFPVPGADTPLPFALRNAEALLAGLPAEPLPVAAPTATNAPKARPRLAAVETTDRRADDRDTLRVFRSAILRWDALESLCLIRNLSPGGMMAKVPVALPPGKPVTVEMRSGHVIEGEVVWSQDNRIGVHFATRIDVPDVLNGPHCVASHWVQRMPRVHVPCGASVLIGYDRSPATLLDVSQGGAKVEAEGLRPGQPVTLMVGGMDARPGCVVWARRGRAGIAFHASIPFDTLAHWAVERQTAPIAPHQRVPALA